MCYMKRDEVGIRELRQNLSKYLRKVERGRTLRVLERGRPVAVLAPLAEESPSLDRLIREGKAIPARGDLAAVSPLPALKTGKTLTETLAEQRQERLP
jgi:prevent-host-death family protein